MTTMSFDAAKALKASLEEDARLRGVAVREIQARAPLGPMGLTAEHIRLSPEYRAAKGRFDLAFARLRTFNAWFVGRFHAELRAERRERG